MRTRFKIAIVHPQLREGGGSESRALWIAEALKNEYDVTIITMGEPDLESLNAYYGTSISGHQINLVSFPIFRLFRKRFDALRSYKLNRYCKKASSEFDVMISTYNVMDFGRKGIQFIADFSFHDKLRQLLHPKKGLSIFFYGLSPLRWIYLNSALALSGTRKRGWERNLTVVNSRWSGKIVSSALGFETQVIYPPVLGFPGNDDWAERRQGFVSMGRLVPEKGFSDVIEMLKRIVQKKHDIHLHILGPINKSRYVRTLLKSANANREWLFIEGQKFSGEKTEILFRHRYGISGCINEAFGIAVAEMVKAGMIVWVPNGGGQVEIVNHPLLIYDDIEDAVDKITRVIKNESLQMEIRRHLAGQSTLFSKERFLDEVKVLVREFIHGKAEA